jgi:WD40 repeat protein
VASRKELGPKHEGHSGDPTHIIVSSKGFLVTASDDNDNSVRIWDTATSRQKREFRVDHWVRAIALSPDGNLLAASSLEDAVHLWNTGTGREIYRLAGHGRLGGRRTLSFLPDGKGLLSFGDDLYLRLWDMKSGKARFEHAIRPQGEKIPVDPAGTGKEYLMNHAITPDGKTFLLNLDRDCHLFDTASGKEKRKFPSVGDFSSHTTISPDSKFLLVSAYGSYPIMNHPVSLLSLSSGKVLQRLVLPGWKAGPVAFSADGRVFATSVQEPKDQILVFEVASGKVRYAIRGYRGQVRALAFLPDGLRLASGQTDSTLLIWDPTSPEGFNKGP